MRIIDRYIIVEILKVLAICLLGFILVFLLVDITDEIKLYFQYHTPGWKMAAYFLVKLPGYLFFTIPLAILLAGMLALLMMARQSEIIAMQASGINALNIARPVLWVGLVASLALFVLNETIIPWSNRRSEELRAEIIGKRETTFFKQNQIWTRSPDSITHIRKFDGPGKQLEGVTVVRWDADYTFVERLFADKAQWRTDHWVFLGVQRTVRTRDGGIALDRIGSMVGPLDKSPQEFEKGEQIAKQMNLVQLGEYVDQIILEGQSPHRYLVDWHAKLAFPLVCLIMAALSVPFAVKVNPRGGGIALGLVVSLVVAFGYWLAQTMFIALGHGAYLPPVAAAWGANVIFGLTAMILLLQAGT